MGCDQLLVVEKASSPENDFRYRIYNADGGEVEQCGNGSRCFVVFVREHGLSTQRELRVETAGGVIVPPESYFPKLRQICDSPAILNEPEPFENHSIKLDELARESRTRRYAAGQVLWTEGDPGEALLVLEDGQLRVTRMTGSGIEVVLSVIDAPAALGELALLDGAPRDASVIAQRAVTVRLIPRSAFFTFLRREPAVGRSGGK